MQTLEEKKEDNNVEEPFDTTQEEVFNYIKNKWKCKDKETLRICNLVPWEFHYRLNFWGEGNGTGPVSDNYINRSILIRVEKIENDWIVKEYEK